MDFKMLFDMLMYCASRVDYVTDALEDDGRYGKFVPKLRWVNNCLDEIILDEDFVAKD